MSALSYRWRGRSRSGQSPFFRWQALASVDIVDRQRRSSREAQVTQVTRTCPCPREARRVRRRER
jgi:hypothetical protein